MKFVALFEVLYSAESMRFNVHMLLHVVQSVRMSGPLWATSAFPFESNIYFLKQLVNGPKGVEQQIAKKSLQILAYQAGLSITLLSNNAKMYCEKLFSKARSNVTGALTANGVIFFDEINSHVYDKCIYNKQVFKTINYNRLIIIEKMERFNCSTEIRKDSTNTKNNEHFTWVSVYNDCDKDKKINLLRSQACNENSEDVLSIIGDIELPHIWRVQSIDETEHIIPISDICNKMIMMNFGAESYVANMPNVYEID